jgi:hypothetical protein
VKYKPKLKYLSVLKHKNAIPKVTTNNSHRLVQKLHSLQALFQLHDQTKTGGHITQLVLLLSLVVQLLLGQVLRHLLLLVLQHSAIMQIWLHYFATNFYYKYFYEKGLL